MPLPDYLQHTIHLALTHIETTPTLQPPYPPRFPTINDAKHFIQRHCAAAGYDYGLNQHHNLRDADPHWIARTVRDRACFLVTVRAYERGVFGLEEGMPDRGALRDAVESAIPPVLSLIRSWPPSFASEGVAAEYIAGVAAMRNHVFPLFDSVSQEKLQGYVCWNSARWAWEGGRFELGVRPRGWRRTATRNKVFKMSVKGEEKKLDNAIEFDIQRLQSLVPRSVWPALFTDLNAARNFVGNWCWENKFRYSEWPDVDSKKYRLYVHVQAARSALEAGAFSVEGEVPKLKGEKRLSGASGGIAMRRGTVGTDDVGMFAIELPAQKESVSAPEPRVEIERAAGAGEFDTSSLASRSSTPSPRSSIDLTPSTIKPEPGLPLPPPSMSSAAGARNILLLSPTTALATHTITLDDPFKDLVAELRRGYLLKAAFD